MSINVVCACGKKLQVKDELAGKRGKCPACGQAMTIPMPAAAAASPDLDPLGGGGLGGGLDLGSLGGFEGGSDPFADPLAGGAATGAPAGGPLGGGFPSAGGPGFGSPGFASPGAGMAATGKQGAVKATPAAAESPWYLKWYVFAGAGAAALLLLIVVGVVVAMFAFGGSNSQPIANTPPVQPATPPGATTPGSQTPSTPAPAPVAEAPKWKVTLADVTMDQGATIFVDVAVDRAGFNDAIQVVVEGLPDRVNTAAMEIPAGQTTAKLVLIAADDAPEVAKPIKLVATSGTAKVEQAVNLAVKKPVLPVVLPIAAVSLSPGQSTTIAVKLERNGLQGDIQVQVEGLPDKVTAQPLTIAADQSAGTLQLSAAADAALVQKGGRLVASVAGKTAESQLQVNIETFSVKIKPIPMPVVWLGPGESATVDVNIDRTTFKGPIELQVQGMPEGVTAAPVTLPPEQSAGKLVLKATADAKEKVRSGKIVATIAGASVSQLLIVRVKKGEGMLLPEVAIDPELQSLLKRGSFGGRLTSEGKTMLEDVFGGTTESEEAIMAGLKWLDKHQSKDGHWSLEGYPAHGGSCDCKIAAEKSVPANDPAATALAVLPFLGAGITPTSSPESSREFKKYQKTVKSALAFLIDNQVTSTDENTNGRLGVNMYCHALATIAMCEAYALTKDSEYHVPAQKAVRYLLKAQHSNGGWGYSPKADGDTSVVGWVFLAIRSGQLAGMPVEPAVFTQAHKYLDSTSAGDSESNRKARYTYKPRGAATYSLTAAGLLTRMYAGWLQDRPELADGSDFLMLNMPPETATVPGTLYYYYYATNVLHHLEGKKWDLWNHRMREHLIRTQEQSGHKKGSWTPEGSDWGSAGGRIYSTSLALLTLEVYYRHLPLYRKVPKSSSEQ